MIRIGIVGCGRILAAHLRGYRLLREAGVDDFMITALCARKEADALGYVKRGEGPPQRRAVSDIAGDPLAIGDEYLSDFQDGVDVEIYTDYRKMIAEAPIDAVNDFTTHGMHHLVGAASFARGKHLLSQKPLAVTVRAARRMCEEAEKAGVTFAVFENVRNHLSTRRLRWAFDDGPCGKPQMVLLGNVGTWWAPDRIVAETAWRHKLVQGGGVSLDLGVHQFDLIRHVAGEVKNVSARTMVTEKTRYTRDRDGEVIEQVDCDADDTFYASFETENGATGTLFGSTAGHGAPTVVGEGPVFYGTKGRVTGDRLSLDGGIEHSLEELYERFCSPAQKKKDSPMGLSNDFSLSQHDWMEAIRKGQLPETSGQEGLIDLACAYAIVESAKAGRAVNIEEVLDGELREYQKPIDEHFGIE